MHMYVHVHVHVHAACTCACACHVMWMYTCSHVPAQFSEICSLQRNFIIFERRSVVDIEQPWSSGRILARHASDPSSILGGCKHFLGARAGAGALFRASSGERQAHRRAACLRMSTTPQDEYDLGFYKTLYLDPRRIAADTGATVWNSKLRSCRVDPSRSSSPAQRGRAHRVGLEELDIRSAGGATLRCLLLAI